jgi:hypothetical protein
LNADIVAAHCADPENLSYPVLLILNFYEKSTNALKSGSNSVEKLLDDIFKIRLQSDFASYFIGYRVKFSIIKILLSKFIQCSLLRAVNGTMFFC